VGSLIFGKPTSEEPTSEEPTLKEPPSKEPTLGEPAAWKPTSKEPPSKEPKALHKNSLSKRCETKPPNYQKAMNHQRHGVTAKASKQTKANNRSVSASQRQLLQFTRTVYAESPISENTGNWQPVLL
jgi:hypothetical protein